MFTRGETNLYKMEYGGVGVDPNIRRAGSKGTLWGGLFCCKTVDTALWLRGDDRLHSLLFLQTRWATITYAS